ncbi:hypothetical protein BC939DRAFT_452950 [Gamsiella multidivaricata]|uniref:uncharacterized protein n=1 Tax=Gamsiella multidivaricata TaxID=101098 RepID=UPI00221F5479|nr:uncharacterized protein BC939DRAFT_452950 [Gamsiella multidivaricata]KAI7822903.1 hypothetical protein BC939DRAFT_452950 [Gamsiella multidivaricata]
MHGPRYSSPVFLCLFSLHFSTASSRLAPLLLLIPIRQPLPLSSKKTLTLVHSSALSYSCGFSFTFLSHIPSYLPYLFLPLPVSSGFFFSISPPTFILCRL